jgi:hypothetical protein
VHTRSMHFRKSIIGRSMRHALTRCVRSNKLAPRSKFQVTSSRFAFEVPSNRYQVTRISAFRIFISQATSCVFCVFRGLNQSCTRAAREVTSYRYQVSRNIAFTHQKIVSVRRHIRHCFSDGGSPLFPSLTSVKPILPLASRRRRWLRIGAH